MTQRSRRGFVCGVGGGVSAWRVQLGTLTGADFLLMDLNQEFEIDSSPQFPNARCATKKLKKPFIYRYFSHSVAVLRIQTLELPGRQDGFKTAETDSVTDIRILLTDKAIAQLAAPKDGWYLARDTELKGFFVVVGKRKRTFTVQGDLRQGGKRASSIRVSIGDTRGMSTRTARATAKQYLAQISQGRHPTCQKQGDHTCAPETAPSDAVSDVTLSQAWKRYLDAHLIRKGRSEKTISSYRDHVERIFVEWLNTPLRELASFPARVAKKHDDVTRENGPYIANGSMRTLRAIYNHARKINRYLPADNPADAVDWNEETRRDTGMGVRDLKEWFVQLGGIENPIRREFHLFTVLSGSRTTALQGVKPEHIDFRRRMLHIPKPKGGAKRAFEIPLSRQMILCLVRAIRFGRRMYPSQAIEWVFPAESGSGHLAETKEDRTELSKWGNDLRQTFRTIAAAAGVSEVDAKLLMNHAIPGVNAGYITRYKLVDDYLRRQQQAISDMIFFELQSLCAANTGLQAWLGRGAGKLTIQDPETRSSDRLNLQTVFKEGPLDPRASGLGPGQLRPLSRQVARS